jgi:pimeloyl-ACP methyl ester carboxylesterase
MVAGDLVQEGRSVNKFVSTAALATLLVACQGDQAPDPADIGAWVDRSPHEVSFVSVAPGVRLEVLDWGGEGPPLVFLPGLGNTAHAYDEFAPRFLDRFHVVAITRRGFGASSHPGIGYDGATNTSDVVAVLDSLRLEAPIMAGHSIAAVELTELGTHRPDRVSRLVYLDTYCNVAGTDSLMGLLFQTPPPGLPAPVEPGDADTLTVEGYVEFVHSTRGVPIPESDIRARYVVDGWNERLVTGFQPVLVDAMSVLRLCRGVQVPALAIIADRSEIGHEEPWVQADTASWPSQREIERMGGDLNRIVVAAFTKAIPSGRAELIAGGHHWVFASHPDEVERLMREFLP